MELKEVLLCIEAYLEKLEIEAENQKRLTYNNATLFASFNAMLVGNMFKKTGHQRIPEYEKVFQKAQTQEEYIESRKSFYMQKAKNIQMKRVANK